MAVGGRVGVGFAFGIAAAMLCGCGQASDRELGKDELSASSAALTNPVATGYPPAVGRVFVAIEQGVNGCHGTLIHPRWMLLAAHCFARASAGVFVAGSAGLSSTEGSPTAYESASVR